MMVELHCFAALVTGRRLFPFRSCERVLFARDLTLVKNEYSCSSDIVVRLPNKLGKKGIMLCSVVFFSTYIRDSDN